MRRSSGRLLVSLALLVPLLAGCGFIGAGDAPDPYRTPTAPQTLRLTSPAFQDGASIPREFTCKGSDISPPLQWSNVPSGARSLALVLFDPDAPNGGYTHWVVFDIDPKVTSIPAGAAPPGARQARNSGGKVGYAGPCPPSGTHRYVFTVYVLRSPTTLPDGVDLEDALSAIKGKAVGQGVLTGTFSAG